MVTEKDVLDALATVVGPDGRTCVSRTNGIAGLTIRDGKVFLSLAGDPRLAEAMEAMRAEAARSLKAIPGVIAATVTLTAEKAAAAPPRAAPRGAQQIPGVARIVAVASGKGGVGKSTTAVNLALGLAATGWRVGILDADVYGPSLPRLLGLDIKPELDGKMLKPIRVFGLSAMSIGFLVAEGEAMIWRGPMVSSAIKQFLGEVAWGELDCLVVDMPPGTGEVQLTLAQSVPLAGAVIVSTPQDLALIDARRGVTMFQKTEVPILGIIENMSYFVCPHCQGRSDIFDHGGARHEAQRLGVPFLGEVPLTLQIRQESDAGRPTVAVAPDSPAGRVYREIASRVRAALEGAPQRQAPRIVIE